MCVSVVLISLTGAVKLLCFNAIDFVCAVAQQQALACES